MTVRIANGAGFLGDDLDAPRRVVAAGDVDYLTLEYLAELTMSILARVRQQNPTAGYARDFLDVVPTVAEHLRAARPLKIVTNAGGVNPPGCVREAASVLQRLGLGDVAVGLVHGDDVLASADRLRERGWQPNHLETGQPLPASWSDVVCANAYLGADGIRTALAAGAQLVVTGRVADASLTLAPAWHQFGAAAEDWDRLAGWSVAGHLIECGAQVTGGYSTSWRQTDFRDIGYPVAELAADGSCVITKPVGSGGVVDRRTVVEQMVYEIADPACYFTPDVTVDFTTVQVEDLGHHRVVVRGATGRPPAPQRKVSLAYADGYFASHQLLVTGEQAAAKARCCADLIQDRLRRQGIELQQVRIDVLGVGWAVGSVTGDKAAQAVEEDAREVVLRLAARDPRRAALERLLREFAPLITNGPAGLAGYAAGNSVLRPVYAYWPTAVPDDWLPPRVEVRAAREWLP